MYPTTTTRKHTRRQVTTRSSPSHNPSQSPNQSQHANTLNLIRRLLSPEPHHNHSHRNQHTNIHLRKQSTQKMLKIRTKHHSPPKQRKPQTNHQQQQQHSPTSPRKLQTQRKQRLNQRTIYITQKTNRRRPTRTHHPQTPKLLTRRHRKLT